MNESPDNGPRALPGLTVPYGRSRTGAVCGLPLLSGSWRRDVRLRFELTLGNFVLHHTLDREWDSKLGVFDTLVA